MFRSKEANTVAAWAVRHYLKHDEPLGTKYVAYLEHHLQKKRNDKTEAENLNRFIAGLDATLARPEDVNVSFALEQIEACYDDVQKSECIKDLQTEYDKEGNKDYTTVLAKYGKKISFTAQTGQSAFDVAGMREALSEEANEVLIQYPGEAGKFFGGDLCRSAFVALQAPEKRGKTNWLMDMAFRAAVGRRKVMFFSVGDLDIKATRRRFAVRAVRRPFKPQTDVLWPQRLIEVEGASGATEWQTEGKMKAWSGYLGADEVAKAWEDIKTNKIKSKDENLRIWAKPASTFKASDVRATAMLHAHQGWVPDVIVIDYADILAPESGSSETRDQINMTWKILNGIRMELNCLVLTATQADADSYDAHIQTSKNFSEDKRKNSHVTGMIGINQSDEEKRYGIQRLNWLMRREEDFSMRRVLVCAGCRAVNNPCLVSAYPQLGSGPENGNVEE